MTPLLLLLVSLALVAACGLFVAAEFAFVTVDRARSSGPPPRATRGAQGVQLALRSLSTQLSGAQVGITVTNLAIGFLAEPAIADLIDGPLAAAGVPEGVGHAARPRASAWRSAPSLTMIFGELVPKNLAIARPMETARATQGFHARLHRASTRVPDPGAQRLGQRARAPPRHRAAGGAALGAQLAPSSPR